MNYRESNDSKFLRTSDEGTAKLISAESGAKFPLTPLSRTWPQFFIPPIQWRNFPQTTDSPVSRIFYSDLNTAFYVYSCTSTALLLVPLNSYICEKLKCHIVEWKFTQLNRFKKFKHNAIQVLFFKCGEYAYPKKCNVFTIVQSVAIIRRNNVNVVFT